MRTVCLHGPESTGKTTLARALAAHFKTVWVPEFGRIYCEIFGNECDLDDLHAIRQGHELLAAAGRRKANELLILDTDAVMTAIWSDILIGMRPPELDQIDDPAELYLLCNVDVPFEADRIRYFPSQTTRETMFAQTKAELERRQLKFVTIAGSREERYQAAVKAIIAEFPEISRA